MKRNLIFGFIIVLLVSRSLEAKIVEVPRNNMEFIVNQSSAQAGGGSYGQSYYRKNTRHEFPIENGSVLNLKDVEADVKIIYWNKDYAEIEIIKLSSNSISELDDKEVFIKMDNNLTLSTCTVSPDNKVLIDIRIKLPREVSMGSIINHKGALRMQDMEIENLISR
jgi:hypothetical protein